MYTIIGGDGKEYGPVSAAQVRSGRQTIRTCAQNCNVYLGHEAPADLQDGVSDFLQQLILMLWSW